MLKGVCFMKKLNWLMVIMFTVILLSGCAMKQEITMKINKNKSLELSFISAFDDELIDMMITSDKEEDSLTENTEEYTDEERWDFLEKSLKDGEDSLFKEANESNLKAEKYEKDGFKGYIFTGKIASIDEITVKNENELDASDITEIADSKLFIKNKDVYKAVLPFDTNGEYDSSTIPSNMGIDMKLIVTLPNKAISSNATSVSEDGKTLTWDLMKLSGENITFEFKFPQNTMLTISLIIGIIIVFVIVLAAIISNKKDKSNSNLNKDEENPTDFNTLNKEILKNNGNQGIMDLYNTQTSLKKITDVQNFNEKVNDSNINQDITNLTNNEKANENNMDQDITNSIINDNNQDKQS